MTSLDLSAYLTQKRILIETALQAWIQESSSVESRLQNAMSHSLMAGGKRLRPVLCLAAAESVGGKEADTLAAACAIEIIHTYSLIHDDLPAMDDDVQRRGKPTCHVAFDEATAILAGDGLLTLAFEVLASSGISRPRGQKKVLMAIRILSRAAGPAGMIQGQMEDIAAEGNCLNLPRLQRLHALKTGALIEASVEIGAVLGGGSNRQIVSLRDYAGHLGLAFQVIDDVLNVEGDPKMMGKAAGTDRLRKKSTYPALMGVLESKSYAKKCIDSALRALEDFDNKADPLRAIARYVVERTR